MESLTSNAGYTALVILFLGVTIFVHEFGHYVAARLLGLVVKVFSIGFGPAIWKTKRHGIVYKISWIPFGGYVALPQLDPTGMQKIQGPGEEKPESYPSVPPWKKIVVALAGGAGNALLAVGIAWAVYWKGIPAGPEERSAAIGFVDPESYAYAQGLRVGDEIVSVNGKTAKKWKDFVIESSLRNQTEIVVRTRDDAERTVVLPTERGRMGQRYVPGLDGRSLAMVLSVETGSAAERAGIESGDTIVEFGGQEILSWPHLVLLVDENRDREVEVKFRREQGGRMVLHSNKVKPIWDPKVQRARIGIRPSNIAVEAETIIHPTPSEQLRFHSGAVFRFLRALMTPKEVKAAADGVGGMPAIAYSYWLLLKTSLMLAIWFTGFLNVNLAIINLLPIPVLDGGHILFALFETVARRPVNEKVANALVNAFAVLLIGLIVFLTLRDIDRFTGARDRIQGMFRNGAATNAAPEAVSTNGP